ncbi:kinase-like domain-containing protein [Cladochytrium replicatum]|nr:kinase-like domain-containing protein [Cladochytrium replicatum]
MASAQIKIGNYTLLETLGVGSFGKVKLAIHSHTGHKVAMKIINRRRIASMDMVTRVKREVQCFKLLRHPHIIKLYEVITTPTDIIMVMEHAGGELFNYIVERGRMSEDDARRFFQQIICAVEYCHRHNIVHRDLKPENVLLDDNNNVKIGDFGLSNIMSDGDFLKTSCGSPNYAAPEVISGRYYAGPEVDVWSCGVILYVMLCGRLPFDDENIPTLFKKINGGIFSLPSFLSPATRKLLTSILVVDPLKRMTIQEIRENEWFQVNLPDYLQPLPDVQEEGAEIDEGIVNELVKKMGFSKATVQHALSETENNQIKVAYQLVLDHKRLLTGAQHSSHKNMQTFMYSTSPPAWNSPPPGSLAPQSASVAPTEPPENSNIQLLSSSLPKSTALEPGPSSLKPTPDRSADKGKKKTRSKWHFGIRSRSPPLDIMLEIYRALNNCGMTWKTIDPYHIRARYRTAQNCVVKLDVQLYRVEANNYLVDFKHAPANGDPLPPQLSAAASSNGDADEPFSSPFGFFEACSKLITELAIS